MQHSDKANNDYTMSKHIMNRPPRVILSESLENKLNISRRLFVSRFGEKENVHILGGIVIGTDIYLTECFIPKASVDFASFEIKSCDVSLCGAEAEASPLTSHLNIVGDSHSHPGIGKPSQSQIDENNRLQIAGLYHIFNKQEFACTPQVVNARPNEKGESSIIFDIDQYKSIQVSAAEASLKAIHIILHKKVQRAFFASLIFSCNLKHCTSYVVEYLYQNHAAPAIILHQDVEVLKISDRAVAEVTGWPMEKINRPVDPRALEQEIAERYQVRSYSWGNFQQSWNNNSAGRSYGYSSHGYTTLNEASYSSSWQNDQEVYQNTCQEMEYLTERSSVFDVADVCQEVTRLLKGDKVENDAFCYLHLDATLSDIIKALKESIVILEQEIQLS